MFSRLILLFILCTSRVAWGAGDIALIDDTHSTFNVAHSASYFIDESRQLSINAVTTDDYIKRFLPINSDFLHLGLTKGNVWVRIEVAIRTTKNVPVILDVNAPRLQYLDVYLPTLFNDQVQAELGEARPYKNRLIEHPANLFPLPANAPPVFTIYLRLSSHLPINAEIHLKTLSKITLESQKDFSLSGFLIGALFILLICNLFFFIKSSNPMYLVYSALLVGIILLHLSLHGQLYQFFPNQTGIQEQVYNFAALACTMASIFFSRLYLNTKNHFPVLDKALLIFGCLCGIFTLLFTLSPQKISIVYLSFIGLGGVSIQTALAIVAFIKEIPSSGTYLLAKSVALLGFSTWMMATYGIIPSPAFYEWGMTSFIVLEASIYFISLVAHLSPFLKKHSHHAGYSQSESFELISDIAGRLRRQINIIEGGLIHMEQSAKQENTKSILHRSLVANHNLKKLSERLDYIQTLKDEKPPEQTFPVPVSKIIDDAYNHFQSLDQDNAVIELDAHDVEQVEVLQNADVLCHFLETIMQEFKHFTDQALTISVTMHDLSHEGLTTLVFTCYPLPTRISANRTSFDLGMSYIALLVDYFGGELRLSTDGHTRSVNMHIPILSHVKQPQPEAVQKHLYDVIIFGQEDSDLQQALLLLQSWPNGIEHFTDLDSLINYLEGPASRRSDSVILIFDNGGHIPHVTHQRIRPLMKVEDQCLLLTNNVKMSREYARSIGFDELLTCSELESQLQIQLERLIRKGMRLKSIALSRINRLRKTH